MTQCSITYILLLCLCDVAATLFLQLYVSREWGCSMVGGWMWGDCWKEGRGAATWNTFVTDRKCSLLSLNPVLKSVEDWGTYLYFLSIITLELKDLRTWSCTEVQRNGLQVQRVGGSILFWDLLNLKYLKCICAILGKHDNQNWVCLCLSCCFNHMSF